MKGYRRPIKVYKIVTKEEFVKDFESISAAAQELDVEEASIKKCLKGERSRASDYTFRDL